MFQSMYLSSILLGPFQFCVENSCRGMVNHRLLLSDADQVIGESRRSNITINLLATHLISLYPFTDDIMDLATSTDI